MSVSGRLTCSFRDPSGFLFNKDGIILRQVNYYYKDNYDLLFGSGLYKSLVELKMLIPHEEIDQIGVIPETAYKIIKPVQIRFISYPYEWCFSQLKEAALLTLQIQKTALEHGMWLKDSSAYNIQFMDGKPVLIDTLSFEKYQEGLPWIAYQQFCRHFLAPLALMCHRDIRLNQMLRIYIDGIPLDLASRLLPTSTRLNLSLLTHIHLHAKSQRIFSDKPVNIKSYRISRLSVLGLIDSLESSVRKLRWSPVHTEWADYYGDTNYSPEGLIAKEKIVEELIESRRPENVWDLGANTGMFSRIAGDKGIETISFDIDPAAVEKNYLTCASRGISNVLPLLLDLTNPSPGIGWENNERMSLIERGPSDMVLALALIHHLAISNNLPLDHISNFFSRICSGTLVIEFVPKNDSQVERLLRTREDIFGDYTQQAFEDAFRKHFRVKTCISIKDSFRVIYLMTKK